MGLRKTLAAQAALSATQQMYTEYREKAIEEFGKVGDKFDRTKGEKKDEEIRGRIVEDRLRENPPVGVLVTAGDVLCLELHTGRYFSCDMQKLRKAQNDINAQMFGHDYATLSDFYYMVGLPQTSTSSTLGWKVGKQLELKFSSEITEDDKPCLAFEYNYIDCL